MTMYANKTTTLAIVAIVTAIALVASGSITASAVAVRSKHTSIKSDSLTTTRTGLSSSVVKELLFCLSSLKGTDNKATPLAGVGNQGTPLRAGITDCVNSALGLTFGSSPSREAVSTSSNSDSVPSTSMMTGQ